VSWNDVAVAWVKEGQPKESGEKLKSLHQTAQRKQKTIDKAGPAKKKPKSSVKKPESSVLSTASAGSSSSSSAMHPQNFTPASHSTSASLSFAASAGAAAPATAPYVPPIAQYADSSNNDRDEEMDEFEGPVAMDEGEEGDLEGDQDYDDAW